MEMADSVLTLFDYPSECRSSTIDMMIIMVQDFDPCMTDELRARRGQKLRFLERQGHWVLVADIDGRAGYIPAAYCRPVIELDEPCSLQRMARDSTRFNVRRSLRLSLGERCDINMEESEDKTRASHPTAQELNAASKTLQKSRKSATLKSGSHDENHVFSSLVRFLRLSKLREAFKAAHAAQALRRMTSEAGNSRAESMDRACLFADEKNALLVQKDKKKSTKECFDGTDKEGKLRGGSEDDFAKGLYSPVHLQAKRRAGQIRRSQSQYGSPHRNSPAHGRRRLGAFSAMMQNKRRSTDDSALNLHDISRDVFGKPTSGEYAKAQAYSPREAHMIFEKKIARIEDSPVKRAPSVPLAMDSFGSRRLSLPPNVSFSEAMPGNVSAPTTRWNSPRRSPKMQRSLTFNASRMSPKSPLTCCSDSDFSSSSVGSACSGSSFLHHEGSDILDELVEEVESPVFEEPPLGSPSRQISKRFLVLFDYIATAKEELSVTTGDIVIQARPRTTARRHSAHAHVNNNPRGSDWTYVMKTTGGSGYVPAELLQTYKTGSKNGVSATAL